MEMLKEGINYKGTPEEIMEVLQRLPKIAKVQELGTKGNLGSIITKRTYHRKKKYHLLSQEDKEYILQQYGKHSNPRIAKKIGSSPAAVWAFMKTVKERRKKIAITAQEDKAKLTL